MSSSMNTNFSNQGAAAASGGTEFANLRQGSSSTLNVIRPQRVQHDQVTVSQRGMPGRRGRGRSKQGGTFSRGSDGSFINRIEKDPQRNSVQGNSADADSGNLQTNVEASGSSNSRTRGYRSGAHCGNGKSKQRRQNNQLIDGISATSGLDLDLAESLAPSSSSGPTSEAGRSRLATNNRKMNLTHLLNYKFERKHRGRYNSSGSDRNVGFHHHKNISSQYRDPGTIHKFSKQQFLQANCQFVVLNGHDYTVHRVDPDWPVDWDCIEEVRFKQSASTETTCPICLEPPVAAKITRCGHIYCWTCMLHYLSLSDEKSRQCPICFEHVYKSDLRSVVSHIFENYSVEEEIVMRLMVRKKGCVEVEPYKSVGQTINSDHYWSQANLVIVDSNTVIAKITKREEEELLFKLALDKDEPEVCFIDEAMSLLKKRVEKLQHNDSLKPPKHMNQTSKIDRELLSKSYLFFQCSDGQHIYLNPFSTKMLSHEYGNLENCPLEIRAKILQMDWISMSEAWRKRFRYLEHLPLTCECRLIEIDFAKSNIISQETYLVYEDQIKRREQEREKRRREERKREKIIQVEQNRRIYGIQPTLKINLDNIDQFPSVSDERYLGLSQPRNQYRTNEDISSDDDDKGDEAHPPSDDLARGQPVPSENLSSTDPIENVIPGISSSFRDIQLQEEAFEAISASRSSKSTSGAWKTKKSGLIYEQSSLAKLLVDAKTSQKEWTRHVSATPKGNATPSSQASSSQQLRLTSVSDNESEELRAPPGEFTISDFIDMKIVTTVGKKRGKSRVSSKKGL